LDALAAQAEQLAGLGFGGNADFRLAAERSYAHGIAQRRLRDADRYLAMQVVAVAGEDRVLAHAHFHVQVARRRARRAGLALALQADAVATVHAGRHLDRQHLVFLDAAVAVAGLARLGDDLPAPTAVVAGLLHGEDAALHAYL